MVYHHSLISVRKSTDQSINMAASMGVNESYPTSRQNSQFHKNKKTPNSTNHQKIPDCSRPQSAVVDILVLIAVICAFGFLLYPYVKFTYIKTVEAVDFFFCVVKEEVFKNPVIYGSLGVSMLCATMAAWAFAICTGQKCENPNCRGLRKAAEFDIQLETEEQLKNSNSLVKDPVKMCSFELPRDHHRQLEDKLKKMAPPNGKAVLVFRARCGCSIGRMEVPGPRKSRKIKK
ncbi:hypothetical protein Nepgr_028828 [Nepenthes gracilis]|uniref:60S ribosomal protein L34 n=1 Tax=Nepenthes gracilis TaxID=150966 RepID=A0AAD3Y4A6_NEPGR|nr:hypothetical protein Nepgr_028828 [Nepenthes gracilis]